MFYDYTDDAKLVDDNEKSVLKDMVVDCNIDILNSAEQFDNTGDQDAFKTHLIQLAKLATST